MAYEEGTPFVPPHWNFINPYGPSAVHALFFPIIKPLNHDLNIKLNKSFVCCSPAVFLYPDSILFLLALPTSSCWVTILETYVIFSSFSLHTPPQSVVCWYFPIPFTVLLGFILPGVLIFKLEITLTCQFIVDREPCSRPEISSDLSATHHITICWFLILPYSIGSGLRLGANDIGQILLWRTIVLHYH